jgi:orotate phosphoribosyltransferase
MLPKDWKILRDHIAKHCKQGEFTLSSGRTSDFYINMRAPLGETSQALYLFGTDIVNFRQALQANVFAGPASASLPLMTAALLASGFNQVDTGNGEFRKLKMVYTRSSSKKHGLRQQVEGPELQAGDRVILVDDVLTTGGSLLKCAAALPDNVEIVGVWVCIDREEGGRENLKQKLPSLQGVTASFKKSDLLQVLEG